MARPNTFTKKDVLEAAIRIIRRDGEEALSARSIGKELGCSSSPIFTLYDNMDSLLSDVRKEAASVFAKYVDECLNYIPAFKEYGLRLIHLAMAEKNLFKLVFFNSETTFENFGMSLEVCRNELIDQYGITQEQSTAIFTSMQTFTLGLAMLCQCGALKLTDDEIGDRLSAQFASTLTFLKSGKDVQSFQPKKIDK